MTDENTVAAAAHARVAATHLNEHCFCITLDPDALSLSLRGELGELFSLLGERPHLFSQSPVFVPRSELNSMLAIVHAIETTAELPQYQAAVLEWAPEIARTSFGPHGAFMGYDFHVGEAGPKLIEVNTNAGGAFLNALLGRAQVACCPEVERTLVNDSLAAFEAKVAAMFKAEWRAQNRQGVLRRIAIVDDAPHGQYLYPEFALAARVLQRHGIDATIADAKDLVYANGVLSAGANPIDLVYNRLVDFALAAPEHTALRRAYLDGAVVATPSPRNHALLADKRNLTLLSDRNLLNSWGVPAAQAEVLGALPRAVRVSAANAAELWDDRKRYFFKPASGHASKAVYRGDKLTKSVWSAILAGDYIAQDFVPPSERTIRIGEQRVPCKLDVRLYTYRGNLLLPAARLYQGQTTNFRTEGGGFAPVFFI